MRHSNFLAFLFAPN
ncbi:TPA: hypothetical protein ACHAJ4_000919, partial [Enterococcus faecium]